MRSANLTHTRNPRWSDYFLRTLTILIIVIVASVVWQIVSIQLRLSRNRAIADRLVESLHSRFPDITFHGGPSYEREVIYININEHLDKATKREIEQWLRQQKAEQKIAPEIELRFSEDYVDESSPIRIEP